MTVTRKAVLAGAACLILLVLLTAPERVFSSAEKPLLTIDKERTKDDDVRSLSEAMAHFLMGSFYDNYGDVRSAVAEYEEALRHKEDTAEIHLKLGSDLVIQGEFDKARLHLSRAAELEPGNIRPYLLQAVIHTARGEFREAEEKYKEALEHDPGNLRVLTFLSDLFIIQQKFDKAAEVYEKMLSIDKEDAFVFFNLGIIYSKLERMDRAEESLKKAIDIDAGYLEAQMVLGFVYEIEGKYPDAIKQYEKVSELDSLNKEAPLRLGQLYYRLGQTERALEQNRMLMRLDMYSPEPYLRNFSIYMSEKRYKEAEAVLLEALRNGISDPVIYVSLGYLAGVSEEYKKAVDYYTVALEKEPDNVMYKFYLAAAMERVGKRPEAVKILEEIVSVAPADLPEAYNYLGYIYVEEGKDLDRAVELIKKALEADPANGAYLDSLGWAYYKKGMLAEALEELKKAAAAMPGDPTVREHLGDAYFELGESAAAAEEWKKSLEADPTNEAVKVKLYRIETKAGDRK